MHHSCVCLALAAPGHRTTLVQTFSALIDRQGRVDQGGEGAGQMRVGDFIAGLASLHFPHHDAAIPQAGQVVGNIGPAQAQVPGQLGRVTWPLQEGHEDARPGRVSHRSANPVHHVEAESNSQHATTIQPGLNYQKWIMPTPIPKESRLRRMTRCAHEHRPAERSAYGTSLLLVFWPVQDVPGWITVVFASQREGCASGGASEGPTDSTRRSCRICRLVGTSCTPSAWRCEVRARSWGSRLRGEQVGQQCLDSVADVVAHLANGIDVLACGVGECPVFIAIAGEERAGITAAHGDDHVRCLYGLGGEDLGSLIGDVDTDLGHGLDRDRVYRLRGGRAGGADFDLPIGQGGEEAGCHLGTSSVVDADEHDAGAVRHGLSFSGWGTFGATRFDGAARVSASFEGKGLARLSPSASLQSALYWLTGYCPGSCSVRCRGV